jgi:signal transduction histidine kinase
MCGAYVLHIKQVTARERGRLEERLGERERIARELHDTLLQGVHGLILRLQITMDQIEVPGESRKAINDELDRADALLIDGRDRVKNLRNATTAATGLMQSLLDAATLMSSDAASKLRVVERGSPRELHPIVREEAARIAIEAMLNAMRHAAAETIEVELCYERRQLRINVRDDGRGMEEAVAHSGRDEHFGILGMHERARRIRGRINVWSRPGAGTEVSLTVPASMAYVKGRWTRRLPSLVRVSPE